MHRGPSLAPLLAAICAVLPALAAPPALPDPRLTPGDTLDVTTADICVSGYAHRVRNVPAAVKRQAYAQYGIRSHGPGEFEVDHLVPLELGGSNSLRNLWPESGDGVWNFHVKDRLETKLHDMACAGEIDLQTAQREIASNWIETYKRVFKTSAPLASRRAGRAGGVSRRQPPRGSWARPAAPPPVNPSGTVWVNTRSGVYWRPGTRYYGRTQQGRYMTEAEAVRGGYRAAGRQ